MRKFREKIGAVLLSAVLAVTCIVSPVCSIFAGAEPITTGSGAKMTFAAWGDPQVANYISSREEHVIAAADDLKNSQSKIDAMVLAGDITENASQSEYDAIYNDLVGTGVGVFITAEGNHDIRLGDYSDAKSKFVSFTNKINSAVGSSLNIDGMHYSCTVKGYKFIILGSDDTEFEESYISNSQLKWLDSQLSSSTKTGKPVFVVMHQPLKDTHGLPDTWGSSDDSAGSVGDQSDDIKDILNKYKNVILITGHLHTGFGEYNYEKIGNINSVNLPSIGVDNASGSYNKNGLGYITEVYDNEVVFRARNFEEGVYVPEYDIKIKLDKVKSAVLSTDTYVYDGKAKKPSVTLYGFDGKKISSKNYTVTYPKGRKNIGEYKIKITFKNALKGNPANYVTFTVGPKGTSISSIKAEKKKFTVKWKKQTSYTDGYEIQYDTSSKFTSAKIITVSNNKTESNAVSGLKSGKKYYVRVRTYKTVKSNGKKVKIYSNWSKVKTVTTK
ncbi:MAG: metallophosphoesterase [Eubacterium sp.]